MRPDDDLDAFIRSHARSLVGTAYLLTGSVPEAEELVQETLVALVHLWPLQEAHSPVAYVRRAVVNRYLSARRGPRGRVAIEPDVSAHLPPVDDPTEAIADRAYLAGLLDLLPPQQRAAIVLRYFHDLDFEVIATALGCRPATARSLVSRGLRALRLQAGELRFSHDS